MGCQCSTAKALGGAGSGTAGANAADPLTVIKVRTHLNAGCFQHLLMRVFTCGYYFGRATPFLCDCATVFLPVPHSNLQSWFFHRSSNCSLQDTPEGPKQEYQFADLLGKYVLLCVVPFAFSV
jgi:hypothetical protein